MTKFFIPFVVFLSIGLQSCQKSYTCNCEVEVYDSAGDLIDVNYNSTSISAAREASAMNQCDDIRAQYHHPPSTICNCTLD